MWGPSSFWRATSRPQMKKNPVTMRISGTASSVLKLKDSIAWKMEFSQQ